MSGISVSQALSLLWGQNSELGGSPAQKEQQEVVKEGLWGDVNVRREAVWPENMPGRHAAKAQTTKPGRPGSGIPAFF